MALLVFPRHDIAPLVPPLRTSFKRQQRIGDDHDLQRPKGQQTVGRQSPFFYIDECLHCVKDLDCATFVLNKRFQRQRLVQATAMHPVKHGMDAVAVVTQTVGLFERIDDRFVTLIALAPNHSLKDHGPHWLKRNTPLFKHLDHLITIDGLYRLADLAFLQMEDAIAQTGYRTGFVEVATKIPALLGITGQGTLAGQFGKATTRIQQADDLTGVFFAGGEDVRRPDFPAQGVLFIERA